MALKMNQRKIYNELESEIGKTPLVKYSKNVPNGNVILIKRECDNPLGSHYDRVYLALFKYYEKTGKIKPGDKILETTSGAAGISFAGIGKQLDYDCYVALPAGGEKAREKAIKEQLSSKDHLILTPAETYISGFPKFLSKFLTKNKDYFFLNHSMGRRKHTNNEITLNALEGITKEVLKETHIDFFIPAVGNGSSILGPGRILPDNTNVTAFETFQSAVAYDKLFPGMYEKIFGIKPGTLSRHQLPGTSYQGINFPHINEAIEKNIINNVVLVSDKKADTEYRQRTGKKNTEKLPHWDRIKDKDIGRTGRAGIAVALDIAKYVHNKKLLVIAYDKSERYDS